MKKLILAVMSLFLVSGVAYAELSKKEEKAVNKEVKAKMKEYTKDNWKIFGSTRTLEGVLTSHRTSLMEMGEDGYEIVGVASNFKSKNIGKQQAVNNACVSYAQLAGSTLKGRVVSDMAANATDETATEEFDRFYAAYERLVETEIKNEMKESFSVIRELPGGTFELQTYFIVNESAASRARMRALENAMKESELAAHHANAVSDFVRKGFDQ